MAERDFGSGADRWPQSRLDETYSGRGPFDGTFYPQNPMSSSYPHDLVSGSTPISMSGAHVGGMSVAGMAGGVTGGGMTGGGMTGSGMAGGMSNGLSGGMAGGMSNGLSGGMAAGMSGGLSGMAPGWHLSGLNSMAGLSSAIAGIPPIPPTLSTSQWPSFTPAAMRVNEAMRFSTTGNNNVSSSMWDQADRYSPTDSVDDILASPNLSDALDVAVPSTSPRNKPNGPKGRGQRRPSNRDEFDGPHQFLQRPSNEALAALEKELPHLPTNLQVQEQDDILKKVNDRLSKCAYDFVAKYQFPIPLTSDMRPVECPQDREWTEWVYLLKRLATKRRIPARVLYNSQIKQLVTVLENSLEMRHAAKHQSRPLKDDRNVLQLISAGIQVAKILKDAYAMEFLDRIYVETEAKIQDRISQRP